MRIEISGSRIEHGWEGARRRCELLYVDDPDTRAELLAALDLFQTIIDPNGVWQGWDLGWPLAADFFTLYQAGPPEGIRLYRLIKRFPDPEGLRYIIVALGSEEWNHYSAACFELQMAAMMESAAASPTALAPQNDRPTPDLAMWPSSRRVVVECTTVTASRVQQLSHEVLDHLFGLRFAGPYASAAAVSFLPGVRAETAHSRLAEIEHAMELACSTGENLELSGLATIVPLPSGIGGSVVGSGLVVGDSDRDIVLTLRSARNKAKHGQLGGAEPGVLAVRARHLFAGEVDRFEASVLALIAQTQSFLSDHRHVSAVLVVEEWMAAPDSPVLLREPQLGRMEECAGIYRASVLVPNREATIPLDSDELEALRRICQAW